MKVEKIAKSLEEYNRLQKLIDEFTRAEVALIGFETGFEKKEDASIKSKKINYINFELCFKDGKYKDINLSHDATLLIRYELISLFKEKIHELWVKQNALEVE